MIIKKEKLIKGLSKEELSIKCIELGFSKYRGYQLFEWMYKHCNQDFNRTNNLPNRLIEILNRQYFINTLEFSSQSVSESKFTTKILFRTLDGMYIETVSMIQDDRHTVCISSQIGCNVDCKFCATGKMGIKRNLYVGEILDQIIYIMNNISKKLTNIVYMGMGEPFLNYNNIIKSADILSHKDGFNISKRRITISTSGILPKIKKFIDEKQKYKLAISLNASNNKTRDLIMPINIKWPIENLIDIACRYNSVFKDKITFEYVLINNINDSIDNAKELGRILSEVECKLNIIPYNDINCEFKRPSDIKIDSFINVLINKKSKYQVLVRWSKGQGIEAGCGQLATNND